MSTQELEEKEKELELSEETWQLLITRLHEYYSEEQRYPTATELANMLQLTYEQAVQAYEKATPALQARGLPIPQEVKRLKDQLHPIFVLATDRICDILDKRSTAAKLKSLDMTTIQWTNLLKLKNHREYFERRLAEAFNDTEFSTKTSLMRLVETGDLNAIKYFNTWTGRFDETTSSETAFNFMLVITKLMEIIARHATPEVIDIVAKEFEATLHKETGLAHTLGRPA